MWKQLVDLSEDKNKLASQYFGADNEGIINLIALKESVPEKNRKNSYNQPDDQADEIRGEDHCDLLFTLFYIYFAGECARI